ncbi:MAG: hypothetical protein PHQ14_03750 [Chromatiales bacterium]|jgi:hypothetical protein|nr:hypothetical protein [Chromatiales bacterium]MDX9765991.1 hypothetical protein [Ectothiorhodospiraceae bacterium]
MSGHIVHIGYHKTGTTWFQRVWYPRVRNLCYLHRKRAREAFLHDGAFGWDVERARRILAPMQERGIILCEEDLSGNIHSGGLHGFLSRAVAERIHATLPDAHIVAFIRNQPDMIASVYRQYVKEGGTHGVNRYLHPERHLSESGFSFMKTPLFDFAHFDYLPLLDHYAALFGRERVHVFPFEAFLADPPAFMADYAARLGLDVDTAGLSYRETNTAYRAPVMYAARFLYLFCRGDVGDKRWLIDVPLLYKYGSRLLKTINRLPFLGRPVPTQRLLGAANLREIQERYAESNRRLGNAFGLDLERHGYPL